MNMLFSLLIAAAITGQPDYATMDDAAKAALATVVDHNTKTEEAGGIYQCGSVYHFTSSVGSDERASVKDLHIQFPSTCKFVALYHTHPGMDDATINLSGYLSDADVKLADDLNVPSYILDVKAGQVHRYSPHKSHKEWITFPGTKNAVHVSAGEVL